METVLLATDGSEAASRAAERALDLASERGATLYVVCVVDRRKFAETGLSSDEVAAIRSADRAQDAVSAVTETAIERGLTVEGTTLHGVPHETILDYADDIGADVVVVGEHGGSTNHLGGVGRRVAQDADCEVVVVGSEA